MLPVWGFSAHSWQGREAPVQLHPSGVTHPQATPWHCPSASSTQHLLLTQSKAGIWQAAAGTAPAGPSGTRLNRVLSSIDLSWVHMACSSFSCPPHLPLQQLLSPGKLPLGLCPVPVWGGRASVLMLWEVRAEQLGIGATNT